MLMTRAEVNLSPFQSLILLSFKIRRSDQLRSSGGLWHSVLMLTIQVIHHSRFEVTLLRAHPWCVRFLKYLNPCPQGKGRNKVQLWFPLPHMLSIYQRPGRFSWLPANFLGPFTSQPCLCAPGALVKPQETLLLSTEELKAFKKQWRPGSVLVVLGFGL